MTLLINDTLYKRQTYTVNNETQGTLTNVFQQSSVFLRINSKNKLINFTNQRMLTNSKFLNILLKIGIK